MDTTLELEDCKMADVSTERLLGELTGTISGIKESLVRIERKQEDHAERMEEIVRAHDEVKAEAKMGIKILAAVATASSVGGASVHHLIQGLLK